MANENLVTTLLIFCDFEAAWPSPVEFFRCSAPFSCAVAPSYYCIYYCSLNFWDVVCTPCSPYPCPKPLIFKPWRDCPVLLFGNCWLLFIYLLPLLCALEGRDGFIFFILLFLSGVPFFPEPDSFYYVLKLWLATFLNISGDSIIRRLPPLAEVPPLDFPLLSCL